MPMSCRGRANRRTSLLVALVVSGLAVAACSNSGDEADGTTTPVGAATSTSAQPPATTDASASTLGTEQGNPSTEAPTASTEAPTASTEAPTASTEAAFQPITGVPGVTDTEIAFAVIGTGAAANPLGTCQLECYSKGIEAYFAFRNSEGGVHGRELKLAQIVDDELANNQVKTLEIINANDTFGTFEIPFLTSGFPDLASAGVPLYTWVAAAPDTAGQESSFANGGVACIMCTQQYYVYIAKQVGATTIGALGYGVTQASKDCVASVTKSVERFGADAGLTVGYSNDALPYGLPNGIAPEVTAMKDAGVDLVFTCMDGNAVTSLKQEMKRQGLDATVVLPGTGYGVKSFFSDTGDLFEGDVATVSYRPFEADITGTGVADFLTWIEQTAPDTTDLGYAMWGWMSADLAYRGIANAPAVFDRQSVIAATNALTAYTGGGVHAPIDWTRQHVAPTEDDRISHGSNPYCVSLVRINGGKWELLGGQPTKPWECWDAAATAYTDPSLMNFE